MGRVTKVKGRPGWYVDWADARGRRHLTRVHGNKGEATKLLEERNEQTRGERNRLKLRLPGHVESDEGLEALIRDWRRHLADERRRPGTLKSYRLGLVQVLGWLEAQGRPAAEISDLELDDVRAFAEAKRAAGASARTVNMRVGALASMCRWAEAEGRVLRNPLARWRPMEGPKTRHRTAMTTLEIAKLLDASPAELADVWRFFLGTGLRTGELAALEWADVDLASKTIRVRREVAKNRKERIIPLRDDLADVVRRQQARAAESGRRAAARLESMKARAQRHAGTAKAPRAERELRAAKAAVEATKLVFRNSGGGSWGQALSRKLKPCLRAAGFQQERVAEVDVHTLRHTFGSHLLAEGYDVKTVQELLGHSSALVTLDIYGHGFADRKRDAVEALKLGPDKNAPEHANKPHAARA